MKFILALTFLDLDELMLPCLTKKFIGIDCPGCGLQRSLALLVDGEFVAAFTMYPAVYNIILLIGFFIVQTFIKIKHANKIILTLTLITVCLILWNYILKFI